MARMMATISHRGVDFGVDLAGSSDRAFRSASKAKVGERVKATHMASRGLNSEAASVRGRILGRLLFGRVRCGAVGAFFESAPAGHDAGVGGEEG